MKYHKQTQFEPPKLVDGKWKYPPKNKMGNCWQTCIACVLDMELEEVPHFAAMGVHWWDKFQTWLSNYNYFAIEILCDSDNTPMYPVPADITCILSGKSPRGEWNHAVVGITKDLKEKGKERTNRFEFLHDPHPDNTFIEDLQGITFLVKK